MTAATHRLRLAWWYAVGLRRLRTRDMLLASFPRSGSTLLRRVLAEALEPTPRSAPLAFDELDARMPELGTPHLLRARTGIAPRFVKTHRPWTPLLTAPHAVWLVRDPLDTLASYHRLWRARTDVLQMSAARFLRHRRYGLPRWIRHTQSWRDRAALRLPYEALRVDPADAARRVLSLARVEVQEERLQQAAALASAERVQGVQRMSGTSGLARYHEGFVFAANRPAGYGAVYFAEADTDWAREALGRAGLTESVWSA